MHTDKTTGQLSRIARISLASRLFFGREYTRTVWYVCNYDEQNRLTDMFNSNGLINNIGNISTSTTAVNRANKTVTQTQTVPESSIAAQSGTVNRLQVSPRNIDNLTYTIAYDALGRQTSVTDPRTGASLPHYDNKNRVDYTLDAAGNKIYYGYDDASGRRLWVKNALNKYTYFAYNPQGKPTRIWGDTDYPTENVNDNFGNLVQLKTFRGGSGWNANAWPTSTGEADVTTWTYDAASGLVTQKIYADGKGPEYAYSVDGKLLSRKWPRTASGAALTTTYGYNALTGELLSIDDSDTTPDIAYTYNRLQSCPK